MLAITDVQNTPYIWGNQKIEMFVNDDRAKNRLRDDLVPITKIASGPKVNLAFIINIVEQFATEISQKSQYFAQSSLAEVIKPFAKATAQVLQLNPTKFSVQVTTTPSVYVLAEIDHQNLHIDLNFNEETGMFEEAVVNIFSNKIQKLNVFGSIEEVSSEIQNYFNPQRATYESFIQSSYAIPGQTYSPFTF